MLKTTPATNASVPTLATSASNVMETGLAYSSKAALAERHEALQSSKRGEADESGKHHETPTGMGSRTALGALGELLLARGLLSTDQLRVALHEQKNTGQALDVVLVKLGFVTAGNLRDVLAERLGQQSICLQQLVVDAQALAWVPQQLARRHGIFPVSYDAADNSLLIASSNPDDIIAADQLRALLGEQIQLSWRRAVREEIQDAIERGYAHELSIDGILHELATGKIDTDSLHAQASHYHSHAHAQRSTQQTSQIYSHPIVRLIDALLTEAVRRGASDIHFEPEAHFLRLRYRIDGVLRQIRVLPQAYWSAMLVRLKVLSGMNIAENRTAQDGRINLSIAGRTLDFRCAVQPSIHGEKLVLRILDHQRGIVPLAQLGFSATQLQLLQRMLDRPAGLLLLTGPTGSGKTTTLYSILDRLNTAEVNIMTLEDPVEYALPGIRQTSLSEAIKLDFANGVRALLRQDPDIILIGEIRDQDTARMALRAAMTGHQVYSTLHTNSAIHAIPRLHDLGVSSATLAGNLIGIIAQRLVRRLCDHCKTATQATAAEIRLLAAAGLENMADSNDADAAMQIFQAAGCPHCEFTGYRGRTAIVELLAVDAALDELISSQASLRSLSERARASGFVSMAEDGLRCVRAGLTSIAEVARVIDLSALNVAVER